MSDYKEDEDILAFSLNHPTANEAKQNNPDYEYNLSKDDWLRLLKHPLIATAESLTLLYRINSMENSCANCTQLSEKFGQTPDYYKNVGSTATTITFECLT